MSTQTNKVIIFSAPSGSGKTTIVKYLLGEFNQLQFSISATSRAPRGQEVDGKDYYFISAQEFEQRIKNEEFIEYEQVYQGVYYGTLVSQVQSLWDQGKTIIFDVDVKGGIRLKEYFKDKALSLFIMPPSVEELESRLRGRGTDSEESILKRIAKAETEIADAVHFDQTIVNDILAKAQEQTKQVIAEFLANE